jgi:murein DD-endopeptidase MepM/ murein hydrolase activator NlpD
VAELFGGSPLPQDAGQAEIAVTLLPNDSIARLLKRAGIADGEAAEAERLIRSNMLNGVPERTEVAILLGPETGRGGYRLEGLRLQTPAQVELSLRRDPSGSLRTDIRTLATAAKVERFTGEISSNLYWSLRQAGTPPDAADEFVRALAQPPQSRRFEAVVATGRRANGAHRAPVLLYAAVQTSDGRAVRRVKWNVGTDTQWLDPAAPAVQASGMASPVDGRITSLFGSRAHPIIRLFRFHKGIDIAAPKGTPIRAAADGRVIANGWNGGYGQQVRIDHARGLETSYSHMSAIAAAAGSFVRQGEVIGYVGSTGLSTGPHLHYEVRRGGQLVDPMAAGLSRPAQLDVRQRGEIARHVQQLMARATLRRA